MRRALPVSGKGFMRFSGLGACTCYLCELPASVYYGNCQQPILTECGPNMSAIAASVPSLSVSGTSASSSNVLILGLLGVGLYFLLKK